MTNTNIKAVLNLLSNWSIETTPNVYTKYGNFSDLVAKENNITFISAGHHATERYGVQALCKHLCFQFKLQHHFIEVDNSV